MNYKNIYKEAVNELNPSPELINEIKTGKENKIVKFSKKKIAVVAAVACMAVGTTAFAAGHIVTYMMEGSLDTVSTDYNSVGDFVENEKMDMTIPEKLSNGYEFSTSNVDSMKGLDEAGNTMGEGDVLQVTYKKADSSNLDLYVNPVLEADDHSNATESREINGVTVYFNKDAYKFVPTDYEKTDEDKQNEAAGHFYISYGSEKVENQVLESIVFEADGKSYNLISFDNNMSVDEWFAMAEDFIK